MTFAFNAGELDRRVRLERLIETRDPLQRAVTRNWVLLADIAAKVSVVSLKSDAEAVAAGQPAALQYRFFEIRYRQGISPSDQLRVVFAGQVFDIESVEELGRRIGLRLKATARAEVAA